MATAHQLYSPERLAGMDRRQLNAVERFALVDAAETSHNTVYTGMDRADTVATARRTVQDTQLAMNYLAVTAFLGG